MSSEDAGSVENEELVIALTPVQLAAVLVGLVILFVLFSAKRAR